MARDRTKTTASRTRGDEARATPPDGEAITKHGGIGKKPTYAEIKAEAARLYREAKDLAGWRVRKDAPPAARELADYALVRISDVAEGRVSFRLAPSVLRAAMALRDEICGPIPTESKITGAMTLEQMMVEAGRQARAQVEAGRAAQAALPPASGEPGGEEGAS